MISQEKALEHAAKVYLALMRQGRQEAQARRDAEAWVKGNYGVEVELSPEDVSPHNCPRCIRGICAEHSFAAQTGYGRTFEAAFVATVNASSSFNDLTELIRDMNIEWDGAGRHDECKLSGLRPGSRVRHGPPAREVSRPVELSDAGLRAVDTSRNTGAASVRAGDTSKPIAQS